MDYGDEAESVRMHPKLLSKAEDDIPPTPSGQDLLKKAVFDSYMSMAKQSGSAIHRRSVLGDLGNGVNWAVSWGTHNYSGAPEMWRPVGARYPAHMACARFGYIQTGWIPPKYWVST